MYLVVVSVETPGWQADIGQLSQSLRGSAAGSDRLQHAYLDVGAGRAMLSLYLQAADQEEAVRLASQLCRRTMAAVPNAATWQLTSIHTL
jgi:hypothetical protein